jgi:hypothetical protein
MQLNQLLVGETPYFLSKTYTVNRAAIWPRYARQFKLNPSAFLAMRGALLDAGAFGSLHALP